MAACFVRSLRSPYRSEVDYWPDWPILSELRICLMNAVIGGLNFGGLSAGTSADVRQCSAVDGLPVCPEKRAVNRPTQSAEAIAPKLFRSL